MPHAENELTLAEWQQIYAEYEKSLSERRFTMLATSPSTPRRERVTTRTRTVSPWSAPRIESCWT